MDIGSLSRLALEWKPIHLPGRADVVLDIFKHSLSATDGLPPYAQARMIDLISNRLLKARTRPCLWVSVDAPGGWFFNEITRLVKRKLPMAILPASHTSVDDTNFYPGSPPSYVQSGDASLLGRRFDMDEYGLKESALRVLRILARLKTAHTREITSLTGLSETYVRSLLKELQTKNLIEWKRIGKYDGWEIKNKGMRLAHRSWNLPKGVHFAQYRGEFRYAGGRHRRISRMWRAWLKTAYPDVEIWESWTEVPVRYGIPDALAWGIRHGYETLFWLEVDSGHSSWETMQRNYFRRIQTAYFHAKEWGVPIVFCIMGPPWVVAYFPECIPALYPNLAIIGHDWREFGKLPMYEVGKWNEDLKETRFRRSSRSGAALAFDPKQYPHQRSKKDPKTPKPKSTKPKFSKYSYDRVWFRRRSEGKE